MKNITMSDINYIFTERMPLFPNMPVTQTSNKGTSELEKEINKK